MDNWLKPYIEKLQNIFEVNEYDQFVIELYEILRSKEYPNDIIVQIRKRATYLKNRFSDEVNKENMLMTKIKLTDYLSALTQEEYQNPDLKNLEIYLENFYLFLEALTEYSPDKRATIKHENLEKITIQNEYDLQHLLYASLKPLYPGIRKEVSKDSGIGTVREDIFIPDLDVVLEAKCTRDSMTLKKLIEEIEADIVHYQEKTIFFYVYDKKKIIKETKNFNDYFNKQFDRKTVKLFVLQPVKL